MSLSLEVEREAIERELDGICAELGDDEIRTLVVLARRLRDGAMRRAIQPVKKVGREART